MCVYIYIHTHTHISSMHVGKDFQRWRRWTMKGLWDHREEELKWFCRENPHDFMHSNSTINILRHQKISINNWTSRVLLKSLIFSSFYYFIFMFLHLGGRWMSEPSIMHLDFGYPFSSLNLYLGVSVSWCQRCVWWFDNVCFHDVLLTFG